MVDRQVQVTVERPRKQIVLIRANGVLDRAAAGALLRLIDAQAELVRHGRRSAAAVLVDVDGVTTFDAAACRELRTARERARRGGFALCLTGCGGRVALLPLDVQQMLLEHRTFPTAEAAIEAHSPRRPSAHPVPEDFPTPRVPVEPRPAVPV